MARVALVGPDGANYSVEAGELDQALAVPGFKLANAPSVGESVGRGAISGATLGWSDELRGLSAKMSAIQRHSGNPELGPDNVPDVNGPGPTPDVAYTQARDQYRAQDAAARAANPGSFTAGEVGGTLASSIPTVLAGGGPVAAGALATGTGALQGAGYSDATSGRQLAADTVLGGGLGLAAFGLGSALSRGAQAVGSTAREALGAARARAASLAEAKVAKELASETGTLGGYAQTLNRSIETIGRLLDEEGRGVITPENKALLEGFKASPVFGQIVNKVAEKTVANAPQNVARVASQEAVVSGLQAAAPQTIANETAKNLAPAATKERAWTIAKRELSPVIGAYLGNETADALGGKDSAAAKGAGIIAGGVFGAQYGRGRLGKSLTDLKNMPSTQIMLQKMISGTAAVPEAIGRYMPSLRAAAARGADALAASHFLLYSNDDAYRAAISGNDDTAK